ncbi:MAG TPA: bacillithiol biosynthesis deacetylase BshB1 [Cytophagaceae bacterium]|jgi:bacillithiol biosynthesis deacetylase BshB1|nr:bacillithiol biosynthesis deacetylase BshB1 [Cytophagaceae bacterium]
MKLDILALASHPDDAELACSGTLLAHIALGKKVGIVDLTRGELGTRGTPETRAQEAAEASKILGISVRENLGLADGFFQNDEKSLLEIVKAIRKYQPEIVLANAIDDRHPDHGMGGAVATRACFLAGLVKIETGQTPWRPKNVYHYIQDRMLKPDFVFDITPYWEKKINSIKAYKSQFFDPNSKEPASYISTAEFIQFVEARALEFGHAIGVKYGEGFTREKQIGVKNLFELI